MIIAESILGLLLVTAAIYFDLAALMDQYYSLRRFWLFKLDRAKILGWWLLPLLLIAASGIVLPIFWPFLSPIALLLPLLSLAFTTKDRLKFTRRSTILFVLAWALGISYFVASSLLLDSVHYIFPFFPFFCYLLLSAASAIAYPFELLLRHLYYRSARKKLSSNPNLTVIGVTGSYGKTTTKNFIVQFLKDLHPLTPQGNLNTPLGLTKFINDSLSIFDRILVVELGVDRRGGMKRFKKFLKLDYAIITAVGQQHIRTFKTLENIRQEKLAISQMVKSGGKIFYEQKSVVLDSRLRDDISWIGYSDNEYSIYQKNSLGTMIYLDQALLSVPLISPNVLLDSYGAYKLCLNFVNADRLKMIYQHLVLPKRRKRIYKYTNLTVIDDSYNINPSSVLEAIDLLLSFKKPHQIITSGLVEIGQNRKLLEDFFKSLNKCDTIIFARELSKKEIKIIKTIDGLYQKIVFMKEDKLNHFVNGTTGSLLVLTTGTKFNLN